MEKKDSKASKEKEVDSLSEEMQKMMAEEEEGNEGDLSSPEEVDRRMEVEMLKAMEKTDRSQDRQQEEGRLSDLTGGCVPIEERDGLLVGGGEPRKKAKEPTRKDILSQPEVDALLTATEGDEQQRIITSYDFKHPARVNKDQLRTLESLHENFARLLASTFSGAMRAVVNVDTAFVDQTTYREFIMSLSNPCCSYQFTLGPTNGQVIIDFAMPVVFSFVDRIFGGKGSSQGVEARQVTPIEIGVINRIVKRVIEDLEATWEPILRVEISDIELETNPEFMQITASSEIVILLAFEVNSTNASGLVSLCYPFFTLESILPRLGQQSYVRTGRVNREELVTDNRARLGPMKIPLDVEMGRTRLAVDEVSGLQVGDVIRMKNKRTEPCVVFVGGKPKYYAYPFATEGNGIQLEVVGQVPKQRANDYTG